MLMLCDLGDYLSDLKLKLTAANEHDLHGAFTVATQRSIFNQIQNMGQGALKKFKELLFPSKDQQVRWQLEQGGPQGAYLRCETTNMTGQQISDIETTLRLYNVDYQTIYSSYKTRSSLAVTEPESIKRLKRIDQTVEVDRSFTEEPPQAPGRIVFQRLENAATPSASSANNFGFGIGMG